ncbi:MAG: cyclic pyranopterin monophosphate synthase MoaC [Bacteroidales bacterium]|nr:cyclic pyranopterin monophosphate synthase MoaC [Bacteroidales bacterium]MDZ4204309.1 cyclic pyranopterin monophosphate synthase MoaC [Bacteroidales bacterium]
MFDKYKRPINYLRISVTDRCNLGITNARITSGKPLVRRAIVDLLALLTVYDMCKAVDKEMVIENIRLLEKSKTNTA